LVAGLIHRVLKQFVVLPEDMKIKFLVLVVENLADAALADAIHDSVDGGWLRVESLKTD
jgi:hypothetical protein